MVFKPANLEGFDDPLSIDRTMIVKYVEQGDSVRIAEGSTYQGKTGMVMKVDTDDPTKPTVRIDGTN